MKRGWWLAVLLLGAACRDESAEAFTRAKLQHETLLNAHTRPEDAKYDAVLAELAKVKPESKRYAEAQDLKRRIEGGRTRVRTPLALGARGTRPPLLEAQIAACARLAELIGQDGGVNRPGLEALEACRKKAELLELQFAHGDEDGGHGEHDGHGP